MLPRRKLARPTIYAGLKGRTIVIGNHTTEADDDGGGGDGHP